MRVHATRTALLVALGALLIAGLLIARDAGAVHMGERLDPWERALAHHGSLITASNGVDYSKLYNAAGGPSYDDTGLVCDGTSGNGYAVVILYDGGRAVATERDDTGHGGGCGANQYNRNFAGHRTCQYYYDGAGHLCGGYSDHGS